MKPSIALLLSCFLLFVASAWARIPALDNNNIARADLANCPSAWTTTTKTSITNQAGMTTHIALDGTSGTNSPNWNRAVCCQDWVVTPSIGSASIVFKCGCDIWVQGTSYGEGTITANIYAVSLNKTCSLQPVSIGYMYEPVPNISGAAPPTSCNAYPCQ